MRYTPSITHLPNRYVAAHKNPQGAGDARPTALQIIQDEGLVGKLSHKVALVTGGTNGIGLELVRTLAKTGMRVFFTSRDPIKGQKVKAKLQSNDAHFKLEVVEMELKSLESVKGGAAFVLGKTNRLDVLMNNAGIAATPHGFTKEGFEQQFGVNHLAHFYLFQLLKPLLLYTAATFDVNVRIISTSSTSHTASTVLPDNSYDTASPNGKGYEPGVSYAHSNTAKIWFCNELERRYGSKGLHAISIQPGGCSSGLMDSSEEGSRAMLKKMIEMPHIKKIWKTIEQGAATNTLAAVGKDLDGVGGIYMEDCGLSKPIPDDLNWAGYGFKSWAFDEDGEKKLWTDSLKMVGMEDDLIQVAS
ncbi:short chain dehydrogenase [Colletotrichum falcatum]|nr:short chain dehydrogenase [Colletotrichum falcatum]